MPNASSAWFDPERGYVRGTDPAGGAQRSAACTGAEAQAGAAGRAVAPLARCPRRGHSPASPNEGWGTELPGFCFISVLSTKQANIYPVPGAIWKQIKSFHRLFLIEPDKPG